LSSPRRAEPEPRLAISPHAALSIYVGLTVEQLAPGKAADADGTQRSALSDADVEVALRA
jgi:hypothetical protein